MWPWAIVYSYDILWDSISFILKEDYKCCTFYTSCISNIDRHIITLLYIWCVLPETEWGTLTSKPCPLLIRNAEKYLILISVPTRYMCTADIVHICRTNVYNYTLYTICSEVLKNRYEREIEREREREREKERERGRERAHTKIKILQNQTISLNPSIFCNSSFCSISGSVLIELSSKSSNFRAPWEKL